MIRGEINASKKKNRKNSFTRLQQQTKGEGGG